MNQSKRDRLIERYKQVNRKLDLVIQHHEWSEIHGYEKSVDAQSWLAFVQLREYYRSEINRLNETAKEG